MTEKTQNFIDNTLNSAKEAYYKVYNIGVCDGFYQIKALIDEKNITDIGLLKETIDLAIDNFNHPKPDPNQFAFIDGHYTYHNFYIPGMPEIQNHPEKKFVIKAEDGTPYEMEISKTLSKYLDADLSVLGKEFTDEIESEIVETTKKFIDNLLGINTGSIIDSGEIAGLINNAVEGIVNEEDDAVCDAESTEVTDVDFISPISEDEVGEKVDINPFDDSVQFMPKEENENE